MDKQNKSKFKKDIFKKSKKAEVKEEVVEIIEEKTTEEESLSFEDFEPLKVDKPKKQGLFKAKKKTKINPKDFEPIDAVEEVIKPEEPIVEDLKEDIKEPTNEEQLTEILVEDKVQETKKPEEEKIDITEYFETDDKGDEEAKKKEPKQKKERKQKKEPKKKKKSKRKKRKERDLQDVKDRKVFKYNNKKYTKVEDFIKYLNDNYLDIDKIAKEVLDDENFYGWLSKRSGVFEQSLKEFKEIKEKIEK